MEHHEFLVSVEWIVKLMKYHEFSLIFDGFFVNFDDFWWKIPSGRDLGGSKSPKLAPRRPRRGSRGRQGTPRRPQGDQKGNPNQPRRAQGRLNWGLGGAFWEISVKKLSEICAKRVKAWKT